MKKYLHLLFLCLFFTSCAKGEVRVAKKVAVQEVVHYATRILFPFDSYVVPDSEFSALDQNVAWLKKNSEAVFILEGHCDEWGENIYNLQLGDLRAREVKAYLIEKGIDPERVIMVVSFGGNRPLDERHLPDAWRQNRRVEFVLR